MEVFLEEHGESIIYGLIGLVMVVTITAVISRGIVNIVPDYKKELSRNNSYQIEKNEYKYPTIIADEVIYADYGDTTFNYMDYIRARDYYNVVVNRIEDSYCNEDVIRECINEAENKGYQLSVKDVTMYNDNPSKLVVLSYNVTFPILNMFNKDNKKQAVIEGYAR